MLKVAVPIALGEFRADGTHEPQAERLPAPAVAR
jgi:hypothetical protein